MKLISCLSLVTLLTSVAFTLGLAFDVQALPLFCAAVTAPVLLIASGDYLSSGARFARSAAPSARRRGYSLPFAA